jgi:pimeloyl-ACP methyl ester carboxylesterase
VGTDAFVRPASEASGTSTAQVSPQDTVAAAKVPIFLIHGQIDSNIPLRHSRQIHARNPNTILWEVPAANHCGAISAAPQEFNQRLLSWFTTTHVGTAASAVPRSEASATPQ